MTVVKINAFTVPRERLEDFARRHFTPPEDWPEAEGFEGAELLIADDGRDSGLLVTRWSSHDAFVAWTRSPDFAARHARHADGAEIATANEIWSFRVVA